MKLFSEYRQGDSLLCRVDARVKILASICLIIMVLSCRGIAFPLLTALLCLAACIGMRIPLRTFLLRFSEPLFIAFVVLMLKTFFSGSDILFSLNIAGITVAGHKDGLMEGLRIAGRIAGAVSVTAVLGFSTPFAGIMAGLAWLRVPKGFIEISIFAYRYIFVLFEDAYVIYGAQKNRLGYSNIRRGLNSFGMLAGSLTLKAFENSRNTAAAMEQRGYDGSMPLLRHRRLSVLEVLISLIFISFMGVLWRM